MLGAVLGIAARGLTRREASRQVDNARKRLRRRRSRLERELENATPDSRRSLYRELENIDTTLAESKFNRETQGYTDTVLEDLERASRRAERSLDPSTLSSRESFRWDMRNAGLSQIDPQHARIFMRLTQEAWQGIANENRLDAIMDAFGSDDIYEIYETVMNSEQGQRALKALENAEGEEEIKRYQSWILKVIPINL